MKNTEFDGFSVELFQDEDGDWVAHLAELPHVSAFGDTAISAMKELEMAWAGVKESYEAKGEQIPQAPAKRDYSGQFNVRIDKRVHRALAVEAARVGLSLNALVSQKLALNSHF